MLTVSWLIHININERWMLGRKILKVFPFSQNGGGIKSKVTFLFVIGHLNTVSSL